jgi:capsular exopolysaccharide synthesis family protein
MTLTPLLPRLSESEQYRALGHILAQLAAGGRTVIAISSPASRDGKTTTAINLAVTLAQVPRSRVLLVDADLRHGAIGERIGIGAAARGGLGAALADPEFTLEAAITPRPAFNLAVLTAGACPPLPYEALASPRFGALLGEMRGRYDHVIVDTPPVVPVADCRALGQWVDGFVLVVAAHRTPRALLAETLSAMDPQKVVGIVFNEDDRRLSRHYRYDYDTARHESPRRPVPVRRPIAAQ